MDPRFRLKRTYPGERLQKPRPIDLASAGREDRVRTMPPTIYETRRKPMRVRMMRPEITAQPNVPQLMRIAPRKIELHAGDRIRVKNEARSALVRPKLEVTPHSVRDWQAERLEYRVVNPCKAYSPHPQRRVRPPVDEWLKSVRR